MPRERRENFRVEWTSPAQIDVGGARVPCIVNNLSNGGASISCERPLPDEFTLRLAPRKGPPRACRVIWRRDNEIGVTFVNAQAPRAKTAAKRSTAPVA